MEKILWQNRNFFLLKHENPLPWLKLFIQTKYKEISELPKSARLEMYDILNTIELTMLEYYKPDKINQASFGNMLPHLHWHIIARFKTDPYFPKTTWEEPVREFNLELPSFEEFIKVLTERLKNY